MDSQSKENTVFTRIANLRKEIGQEGGGDRNGRIMSIINTKLQEAELFAKEAFNKEA